MKTRQPRTIRSNNRPAWPSPAFALWGTIFLGCLSAVLCLPLLSLSLFFLSLLPIGFPSSHPLAPPAPSMAENE